MPLKNKIKRRQYHREWTARNKKHVSAWYQQWRNKVRNEILTCFTNIQCVNCGITDTRVLQVDHVYDDGADERRQRTSGNPNWLLRKIREHPERYQLLCCNCNWLKELIKRNNSIL